jgi:glutamine amidotransferase
MQLMTRQSEEGDVKGLGWFDTEVVRFRVQDSFRFKVPHVGWNQMRAVRPSRLLLDIPEGSEFYFVHSFHAAATASPDVLCETEYDYFFPSGLEKDNLFALQFHPEKSHDVGEAVLQNFVRL